MSPRFVLGQENVPCVAEVVNRSLKADCTDFTPDGCRSTDTGLGFQTLIRLRCLGPLVLSILRVYTSTEVVPIIKCTCTVFIDNFRNISTNLSIQASVCRGSYDGYVKHKRNDPTCDH